MGKIKETIILMVCFAMLGIVGAKASAEEIPLLLTGGVYRMISSPYMPEDRDPQASLVDDLGAYNKTQWRFFHYDPGLGAYAELKGPDWDPPMHDFEFGRGYWIISRNSVEIGIEGTPIVGGDQITLRHEGTRWNQIGNIFDYDFPIASLYVVRASDPDPLLNRVQLIDAVNNDLTYVTLQDYENGSYVDVPGNGSVEVGKGYWLRVREGVTEDVILWFVVRVASPQSNDIHLSEEFLERVSQQEEPPPPPPAIESSSSVSYSGSSGGGGCFIATAAYGDYDHPSVQLLREFRDRYLLTNRIGRIFVDAYYRYSPPLARFVAKDKLFRSLSRVNLMPFMGVSAIVCNMSVYGFLIAVAFPFLGSFFLLRRRKGVWGKCRPKFSGKPKEIKRGK